MPAPTRTLLPLLAVLAACEDLDPDGGLRKAPPGGDDTGRPLIDEDAGEVQDRPMPDGEWFGTEDDAPEPETVGEVCYPGADSAGDTCVPVVAWDPAWGSDYEYPEPLDGSAAYSKPARFVDLSAVDPALALAPNFVLDEFMQEWKGRYGVYQPHVVETLQAMRSDSGGALYVNSGYRSPGYNASLEGSATWSRHMYGDAVDMYSATLSLSELGDLCESYGADYVGMYSSHVHCDWRYSPLEPAFYD